MAWVNPPSIQKNALRGDRPLPRHLRVAGTLALLASVGTSGLYAATFTVSKDGRGAFSSIQAAVNAAKPGDVVDILDAATYAEQVTIDSTKNSLTLIGAKKPTDPKPTILYQDKIHVGPRNCQEALTPAKIDFDQNGALRVLQARNVRIEGVIVDGGGAYPFGHEAVWGNGTDCNGQLFALAHGNAALVLWIAGDAIVRHSEFRNAYFGISVKDRNEGGIFANANPADLEKWKVVPLSGFAKTGNHLVEHSRIHDNSWGFFFESAWDLGSTLRYNLIYENYHKPATIPLVKDLPGSEGTNQPGGAMMFKDVLLTPLAIYNNTFWHNFLLFSGHWRAGAQHLLFNNLYGSPNSLWATDPNFPNPFHAMDPKFVHRQFHNIYSVQAMKPVNQKQDYNAGRTDSATNQYVEGRVSLDTTGQVRIMNGIDQVEREGLEVRIPIELSTGTVYETRRADFVVLPGARIVGQAGNAFPAASEVRWLEIPFQSTDPKDPNFLEPDWDFPAVAEYIKDGGWPAAGLTDVDGSPADIGAIASGGTPEDLFITKALSPVFVTGTEATLSFSVTELTGKMLNPTVKLLRWNNDVPFQAEIFGNGALALPAAATLNATGAVQTSGTTLTATVPSRTATQRYAFAEILIQGTDATGRVVHSNLAFLPFRQLDYRFLVQVFNEAGTTELTEVQVGVPVKIKITPQQANGSSFTNTVKPVEINLNSGSPLFGADAATPLGFPSGITGTVAPTAVFTRVPAGGLEIVRVSGLWENGDLGLAFLGVSKGIRILPGAPAKVAFQSPPSKIDNPGIAPVADPGIPFEGEISVYDAFNNQITAPTTLSVKSNQPGIGDIVGAAAPGAAVTITTDSTGLGHFQALVTEGEKDQLFELEASIPGIPSDKADLKVGELRDKLVVFYGDAATGYDPAVELRGEAGTRLPVTIRATQDGTTPLADRGDGITVTLSSGLAAYADAAAAAAATTFTLTAGEVVIWVTGLKVVENGSLSVSAAPAAQMLPGSRAKIFFALSPLKLSGAEAHADNGVGAFDRLVVRFDEPLKAAPDSLEVDWPGNGTATRKIKTGIQWDAANPTEVTALLPGLFPAGVTQPVAAPGPAGRIWVTDPDASEAAPLSAGFIAADKIGPVIDSARVFEKLGQGNDSLLVSFSEPLAPLSLTGASLVLVKDGGAPIALNILSAAEIPDAPTAMRHFKVVVADLGSNAPTFGDTLRIAASGPVRDANANPASPLNVGVPLGLKTVPRPLYLNPLMDGDVFTESPLGRGADFIVFIPGAGSQWVPHQGSLAEGPVQDCGALACGGEVTEGADGRIDRPSLTVETDRGFRYQIRIFNNLGEYVNGFSGEITNAELGLSERAVSAGVPTAFTRNAAGNFEIKLAWNGFSKIGRKAGTGAYIVVFTTQSQRETAEGGFEPYVKESKVRIGLLRD